MQTPTREPHIAARADILVPHKPRREGLRELRVRLEETYFDRLQALRVLRGKAINEVVQEALDIYFAREGMPATTSTSAEGAGPRSGEPVHGHGRVAGEAPERVPQ